MARVPRTSCPGPQQFTGAGGPSPQPGPPLRLAPQRWTRTRQAESGQEGHPPAEAARAGTCVQRRPVERDRGGEQRHHGCRSPTRANSHPRDAGIDLTSAAGADCHTAYTHGGPAGFRVPSCPRAAAGPPPLVLFLGSWRSSPRTASLSLGYWVFPLCSRRPPRAAGRVRLTRTGPTPPASTKHTLLSAQTIDNQDTQSGGSRLSIVAAHLKTLGG